MDHYRNMEADAEAARRRVSPTEAYLLRAECDHLTAQVAAQAEELAAVKDNEAEETYWRKHWYERASKAEVEVGELTFERDRLQRDLRYACDQWKNSAEEVKRLRELFSKIRRTLRYNEFEGRDNALGYCDDAIGEEKA